MKSFLLSLLIMLTGAIGTIAQTSNSIVHGDSAIAPAPTIVSDSQPETISVEYLDDEEPQSDRPLNNSTLINFKLVQIFGLLVPFGSAIIIVAIFFIYLNRRQHNKLRIIEMAITNNYQLPDAYYQGKAADPHRYLLTGIYWIGGGIAACLTFISTCDDIWPIGLFPLFIGIARLAVYFSKMNAAKQRNDQ